ncbi:hypothetical protein P5V15_012244 [Pogonomyrmex californicus]
MIFKRLLERFGVKTKEQALFFRQRLAILYAFIGWNSFGVILYMLLKKEMPEDDTERRMAYSLLSSSGNLHVYQLEGMKLTNNFNIAYKVNDNQIEEENKE